MSEKTIDNFLAVNVECELCQDTGVTSELTWDDDAKQSVDLGEERPCLCKIEKQNLPDD